MQPAFEWRFVYNPRFWPTWIGLALLWLSTHLPYRVIYFLGHLLGMLIWVFGSERRRITRTNLRLCFPHLDQPSLKRLLRQSYYSVGLAVFESALSWWGSDRKLKPLLHIKGQEHIQQAVQYGKGAILLGGHYATLEMAGRIMSAFATQSRPTYKRAHDPLFDWVMARARTRQHDSVINSNNMREVLRTLKSNQVLWYAPDQDFGMKSSVFAPFMGIATATLTLTARLAKQTGAPVLPWYSERLPNAQGYLVRIGAPLQDFPSGDDVKDATTVNQVIEAQVRRTPEQYFWGHRRFKTRPLGEPMVYAPRRDRSLRRYTLLNAALAVPLLLYTLWLANRNRDLAYLEQRLSLYPERLDGPVDIWFHAASVGEAIALLPLIEAMAKTYPYKTIILTTFTPTGGAIARKRLPANIKQYYLPIDWVWCVKRFLAQARPRCVIIMETELWPNLLEYCYNTGVSIYIVNGRLSDRTVNAPAWIRHLTCRLVQYARRILARSETDLQRFRDFGAHADRVELAGNLKFAITSKPAAAPINLGRPYVLAASTHADEEVRLARMWCAMHIDSHLLVIAPRHPHRSQRIRKQLQKITPHLAVRSQHNAVSASTQIYLADTFGELNGFIAGSAFVFMGGSLVKAGGHNILEVGAQGKAVIFGPHMENFLAERELFLQAGASIEVKGEAALQTSMQQLLMQPAIADAIGQRALSIMQSQQHILEQYLSLLATHIN